MTLLLPLIGLFCLSLSMARHQRDLLPQPLPRGWSRALRSGGWAMLCLSTASAVSGGALSVLLWIGELSIAVLFVAGACTVVAARRKRMIDSGRS